MQTDFDAKLGMPKSLAVRGGTMGEVLLSN